MKSFGLAGLLRLAVLLVPAALSAQERTVTGTVIQRETRQPLPGVAVAVRGTMIVVVTDAEGFYSLRVPADAETLAFSRLGYRTQEIPVAPRVDVEMFQEAIGIEGLTVTALGVRRERRSLGYSVQDVAGTEISGRARGQHRELPQGERGGAPDHERRADRRIRPDRDPGRELDFGQQPAPLRGRRRTDRQQLREELRGRRHRLRERRR